MTTTIPVAIPIGENDFTLSVSLEGQPFSMDFSWSERSLGWYCNIYGIGENAERIPVVTGKRLVHGWPITVGVPGIQRPAGEVVALDTSGQGIDAAHDDLGTRVKVIYYTADEVEALGR